MKQSLETTHDTLLKKKRVLQRKKEELRDALKALDFGEGLLRDGKCNYPFSTNTFTGLCDLARWRANVLKKCVAKTRAKKVLRRVETLNKKIAEYKEEVAACEEQAV